jgi:hypothetical protein
MKNILFLLSLVGFVLAMTLTISCSSDTDDNGDEPYTPPPRKNTYFMGTYGITDEVFCYYLFQEPDISDSALAAVEYTFKDIKDIWLNIRTSEYGIITQSITNYSESALRNDLAVSGGMAPSQVNAFMNELNNRGNSMLFFYSNDYHYCAIAAYYEKE